jgi:hypothetical protein
VAGVFADDISRHNLARQRGCDTRRHSITDGVREIAAGWAALLLVQEVGGLVIFTACPFAVAIGDASEHGCSSRVSVNHAVRPVLIGLDEVSLRFPAGLNIPTENTSAIEFATLRSGFESWGREILDQIANRAGRPKFIGVGPWSLQPSTSTNRHTDKTPVQSLINADTGEVRSAVVPNVTAVNLRKVMSQNIDMAGSTLYTDEALDDD